MLRNKEAKDSSLHYCIELLLPHLLLVEILALFGGKNVGKNANLIRIYAA